MNTVRSLWFWFYTSILFKSGLAIIGGVAAAAVAYILLQLPAPLALLGIVTLIVFTWATVPLGIAFSKSYFTKRSPTNGEVFAFVFLVLSVMLTACGLFLFTNIFGDTIIRITIGFAMILFLANILAGMSIQASSLLPPRRYGLLANWTAVVVSTVLSSAAFTVAAIYLIRMAHAQQMQAFVNVMVMVITGVAFSIPFVIIAINNSRSAPST